MDQPNETVNPSHDADRRPSTAERARQWTFHAVSPGDSHHNGELSLCVGEAA
jgi:hypothetical protein